MIKVSYWVKGSREKSTEVIRYQYALEVVTNAQDVHFFEVGYYLDILKEQMEDNEESGMEYLIEKLEKLNLKTKICKIDTGNGEPTYFIVPGFEDKDMNYIPSFIYIPNFVDDFCKALLSSKAFWNYYNLHNITINGKSIEPVDNGVERLG